MFKKEVTLLIKYIFVFIFLLFSPLLLYVPMVCVFEKNIFVFVPLSMFLNGLVCLIVSYIEIKLCQRIVKKHADTMLIKLLSTNKVPIIILFFLILLDVALPISFVKVNDWLSPAILFYTSAVSFSGSFLPAFIMSIDYKNVLSKTLPEFYDESNNFITIIIITIFTFGCKLIGMGIFMPLHVEIHNLLVR